MYQGQTLVDSQGNQVALFPLDYLYITQGEFGTYSHEGSRAIDFVGTTIEYPYYAPVDLVMVHTNAIGSYIYESLEPVRYVDGRLDYLTVWVVHDNDPYPLNRIVLQGQLLGRTGISGNVAGDHLHMEVAKGKYTGYHQNSFGTWILNNQISMVDVFSIQNTQIVNSLGYNWREYQGGVVPPSPNPENERGLPIWLMGSKIWN